MDEMFKLALNGGVGVVLAYLVLKWQREDGKNRANECRDCAIQAKAWAQQEREDKIAMRDALEGNTRAITVITEMIRRLSGEDFNADQLVHPLGGRDGRGPNSPHGPDRGR